MLNKKELVKRMESFSGGIFIKRKTLAECMGRSDPHSVDKFLKGLPRVDSDLYFIPDVADAIIATAGIR